MGALQPEHFPRSHSHETTGMFSYQGSWWPHFGQRERGRTMLSPSGTRAMTTFRKLPTARLRSASQMVMSVSRRADGSGSRPRSRRQMHGRRWRGRRA
jgi:hypothetical protein